MTACFRSMRFFASFLFVALALAGCTESTESPQADGQGSNGADTSSGEVLLQAPADPPVGTTWNHQISGPASGTSSSELVAKDNRNEHDAHHLSSTIEASGTTTHVDSWNRILDGGVIEATTETDAPYIGSVETHTTFDPPCARLEYPVRAGADYEVTCSGTTRTNFGNGEQTFEQTTQVAVQGLASVTVPAGMFDTVHVIFTVDDSQVDEYFLLDGCGSALSIASVNGDEVRTELTATTC